VLPPFNSTLVLLFSRYTFVLVIYFFVYSYYLGVCNAGTVSIWFYVRSNVPFSAVDFWLDALHEVNYYVLDSTLCFHRVFTLSELWYPLVAFTFLGCIDRPLPQQATHGNLVSPIHSPPTPLPLPSSSLSPLDVGNGWGSGTRRPNRDRSWFEFRPVWKNDRRSTL